MTTPESPAPADASAPEKRKRGYLLYIAGLTGLIVAFYLWENYSGPKALRETVAAYGKAGFPLDPAKVLPGPVPDAENFCAHPLLAGIAATREGKPTPEAERKIEAIAELFPKPKPGTSLARSQFHKPNTPEFWAQQRQILADSPTYNAAVPADETDDAKAVYAALQIQRPLLDELAAAAASRPLAVFTPAPVERAAHFADVDSAYQTSKMMPLVRLIQLHARAAVATGHPEEAAAHTAVLWKLHDAANGERTLIGHLVATTLVRMWCELAHEALTATGTETSVLEQFSQQIPATWNPQKALLNAMHGEAMYIYGGFSGRSRAELTEALQAGFNSYHKWLVKLGPRGWIDHSYDFALWSLKEFSLHPLAASGFRHLSTADKAYSDQWSGRLDPYTPYRLLGPLNYHVLYTGLALKAQTTRLTQAALAMELHRRKHGRFPASLGDLIPEFLAAVPPDIDDQPLRLTTAPDGTSAVLYSVGWNMTDDWHGTPPAGTKTVTVGEESRDAADWVLPLPLQPAP